MKYSPVLLDLPDLDAMGDEDLAALAASTGAVGAVTELLLELEAAARENALAKYVRRIIMMCVQDVVTKRRCDCNFECGNNG